MKKLFTLFLALVLSVGSMSAWIHEHVKIGDLYYEVEYIDSIRVQFTPPMTFYYDTIRIVSYFALASSPDDDKYAGNIVIPDSVEYNKKSYYIEDIGSGIFANCTGLTSVTIGNNVTNIGKNAFEGCSSLTSVTIPNSVIYIGKSAFYGCSGLTSVIIPNNITYISSYTFSGCSSLTSITIPNSVTRIEYGAFEGCTSLPVVNNLRYADTYLVEAVDKTISSCTIIEGTKWIGIEAFANCTDLTSVTLPNSVTDIGYNAFSSCSGLLSIEIPNSVINIQDSAFYGCTSLISIEIPNSVISIGSSTFSGCSSLTSVTIPSSLIYIGSGAFKGCTSLPVVDNLRYADTYLVEAVDKTLSSCTIKEGTKWIGIEAFFNCSDLISVTIPNCVKNIDNHAFLWCTSLATVTMGNSVTSLGFGAFYGCTGLTSIYNYATTPQVSFNVFGEVDKSTCKLYVPVGSVDLYKSVYEWKEFENILPISANDTETTDVQTTPTDNSVDVTWPAVDGAYTYELVIKDKEGNIVCTLIFNAQGQLTSIAFNAPAHNDAPQKTQTAGFVFTVTGLETGTEYDLTITAKNENGLEIDKKNISFHTSWPQGIEDIYINSDKSIKVLHDGHIYILRGDRTYTVTGQEVK